MITHKDGETTYEEGCLSVPGIYDTVTRAERVTVEACNGGEKFTLEADGPAICIQHELDHLLGKVFVESLLAETKPHQNQIKKRAKHDL